MYFFFVLKRSLEPSFVKIGNKMKTLITLLLIVVAVSDSEDLTYCDGKRVKNLEDLSSLKECDVIEGNLIIGFNIASSTEDWRQNGGLRVKEITGFVVFYFLNYLTSLDLILPDLRVIRGNVLYENYALIIYGLMDLKSVRLNNLSAILRGSVFIRNNPWLDSFTHRILWDQITYWNTGPDFTHMNVIQHVPIAVVMCNKSCELNGNSIGYCWSPEVCQNVCPESGHPLSCTESGEPCPEKCVGGCYVDRNETKCHACRHFRKEDGCAEKCFPDYQLNDFRCVKKDECRHLGGKLLELKDTVYKCVKECPSSYKPDDLNPSLCVPCSGCFKEICKGLSVIDSVEEAQRLTGCTKINGSLEIRVHGKRILQTLIESLGEIREVDGYVHVFQSRELKSLKFLEKLVTIGGNELWKDKFSFIIHDNDDLEQLWNTTSPKLNILKGQSMFYANPKLCSQNIEKLVGQKAWKDSVPDDNIRMILNGNKKACYINKNLDFSINPLFTEGGLRIDVSKEKFSDSEWTHLVGFYVHYIEAESGNQDSNNYDRQWERFFTKYNDVGIHLKLKPATKYGIYLESKSTDSFRNSQSVIKYGTTKPFNPSLPQEIEAIKTTPEFIEVSWVSPQFPNGEIDHYVVLVKPIQVECNSEERKQNFEYFEKEIEKQKLIEKSEEEEKNKTDSAAPRKSSCPSKEDASIDQSVDRKREHVSMGAKLAELMFIDDPSSIRIKRDAGSSFAIDEICLKIDRQMLKALPSGLARNLDSSPNIRNNPRLNLEEPLTNYLLNSTNLLSFERKLMAMAKHNPSSLSTNCGLYLFNIINNLRENDMKHSKRNNLKAESKKPTRQKDIGEIVFGTRVKITNLTSSLYDFRVMACHKQFNSTKECGVGRRVPCKLCSQWQKSRINFSLNEDKYRGNITVIKTDGNNVSVSWTPPHPLLRNEILYYKISVQEVGNSHSTKRILPAECGSSFINKSSIIVPEAGNYSISITAFSAISGELLSSYPDTFLLKENFTSKTEEMSGKRSNNSDIVILMLVFLFIFFIFGIYWYKRGPKKKVVLVEVSKNPAYGSKVFPPWKDYLEQIIDEKFLFYYPNNLEIKEDKVGQGNFGEVHQATIKDSKGGDCKVAVKKLKSGTDGDSDSYKELINEASLMLQIKSTHLVELFGVAFTDKELYLVMEFMHNKSLYNYLKEKNVDDVYKIFTRAQIVQIAVQIADGMAYLSHKNILHMDLATRNCLLDKQLNAKVSDFGMSRKVEKEKEYYKIRNDKSAPIRWMPPEYFKEKKFTIRSDVWSYAVLLWEVMNPGKLPYENIKENKDVEEEVRKNIRPGTISLNTPYAGIMNQCWNICPNNRPTFRKIVYDLLLLQYTTEKFKKYFENKSFYYRGESQEYVIDVAEIDEQDVTPNTPLTTPSLLHTHISGNNKLNSSIANEDSVSVHERLSFRRWHRHFSSFQNSLSKSFPFVNNIRATLSSSQNKIDDPVVTNGTSINIEKEKIRETVLCISPSRKILISNHVQVDINSEEKCNDVKNVQIPNGNHKSYNEINCSR